MKKLFQYTILIFLFFAVISIVKVSKVHAAQICGEVFEYYDPTAAFATSSSFTGKTFSAPTNLSISSAPPEQIRVVGVKAKFHDYYKEWNYHARVKVLDRDSNSMYESANLSSECGGPSSSSPQCPGYSPCHDMCTPNSMNVHTLMISNYQSNNQTIKTFNLSAWKSPNSVGFVLESVTWLYTWCVPSNNIKPILELNGPGYFCHVNGAQASYYSDGAFWGDPEGTALHHYSAYLSVGEDNPQGIQINLIKFTLGSVTKNASATVTAKVKNFRTTGQVYYQDISYKVGTNKKTYTDYNAGTDHAYLQGVIHVLDYGSTVRNGRLEIDFAELASMLPNGNYDASDWVLRIEAWAGTTNQYYNKTTKTISISNLIFSHNESFTSSGNRDVKMTYSYYSPQVAVTYIDTLCFDWTEVWSPSSNPDTFTNCGNQPVDSVYRSALGALLPYDSTQASYANAFTFTGAKNQTRRIQFKITYRTDKCGSVISYKYYEIPDIIIPPPPEEPEEPPVVTANVWMQTLSGDTFVSDGLNNMIIPDNDNLQYPTEVTDTYKFSKSNNHFFSTYINSILSGTFTKDNIFYSTSNRYLNTYNDTNAAKYFTGSSATSWEIVTKLDELLTQNAKSTSSTFGSLDDAKTGKLTSGTLNLPANSICNGQKIIFVNGDLNITPPLTNKDNNSGCLFIVTGKTNISAAAATSSYDKVEALIISRDTVSSGSIAANSDPMLYINGSVLTGPDLNFKRNVSNDAERPSELIKYDPRYLELLRSYIGADYGFKVREVNYQ